MQEMPSLDNCILGLLYTLRMRRLYGSRNDRILWSPPVLEVNLLRSVPRKICLCCAAIQASNVGVPIDGPANVFYDNNGVVKNTTIPESMLAKKHNAINYHAVREAVAAKIIRVGKEDGMTNLADLFTKVLTADRRRALCRHIMY